MKAVKQSSVIVDQGSSVSDSRTFGCIPPVCEMLLENLLMCQFFFIICTWMVERGIYPEEFFSYWQPFISTFQGWWRCPDRHRCRQNRQRTCLLVACQNKSTADHSKQLHMHTFTYTDILCSTYTLPELVDQVGCDTCARSTKRMSDGDSTSVNVALLWVQTESLGNSKVLRGKSFIHLRKEDDFSETVEQ